MKNKNKNDGLVALLKHSIPATQFELWFRFVAIYLVLPAATMLMRLSYRLAGYHYVRSDNLTRILKNPLALVYLIVIFAIYTFLALYEITMLIRLSDPMLQTERVRVRALSKLSFWQNLRLLRKRPLALFLLLLFFVPLFSVTFSSPLLPKLKIPSFIMDTIFQSKLYTGLFIGCMLLLFLVSFASVFTFHGIYLSGLSLKKSLKESLGIVQKHGLRILWRIIWVELLLLFVAALVSLLFMFLLGFFVVGQIEHQRRLLVLLTLSSSVKSSGQWFLGAFSVAIFLAMTTQFYRKYTTPVKGAVPFGPKALQDLKIKRAEGIIGESYGSIAIKIKRRSNKKWYFILALVFMAVFVFEGFKIYLTLNSDYIENQAVNSVKVTAHRGFIENAPENTLAAVQESIDAFADYVEIDVQLTKDAQVVVFHDRSLKRMTGDARKLTELNYADLEGVRFLPSLAKNYPNEKIPLLSEVLNLGKNKIRFNVELKPSKTDSAALAAAVVREIKKADMADKVLVASLNLDALKSAKKAEPEMKTLYILPFVQGDFSAIPEIDHYSIEESLINAKLVERLHEGRHQVHAWTVNDEETIKRLSGLGVDNIISDEPILVAETLARNTPEQRFEAQVFDWLLPVVEFLSPTSASSE